MKNVVVGVALVVGLASCGSQSGGQPAPSLRASSGEMTVGVGSLALGGGGTSTTVQNDLKADLSELNAPTMAMTPFAAFGQNEMFDVQAVLQSVLVSKALPTGVYECVGKTCTGPSSDPDLVYRWKTKSGKPVELRADWDGSSEAPASPTVQVLVTYNNGLPASAMPVYQETPTKLRATLTVGGVVLGKLNWDAAFRENPNEAGTFVATPKNINLEMSMDALAGHRMLGGKGSLVIDAAGVRMAGEFSQATKRDNLKTMWDINLAGAPVFDAGNNLKDFNFAGESSVAMSLQHNDATMTFGFKASGFSPSLASEFAKNPKTASVKLSAGKVQLGNKFVTFDGTLDDSNGNGIPGENVTLVFKDNETKTLEQILQIFKKK